MSVGGLNYCHKVLIDKNQVKIENFVLSKKIGYNFTPICMVEKALLTSRFFKRQMSEYETLKAQTDARVHEIDVQPSTKILGESVEFDQDR
jgi:hypothetical protein